MVVDRTWRSPDRRWLVDEVVDEPGLRYRVWDAEGAPVAEAVDDEQLHRVLDDLDVNPDELHRYQPPTRGASSRSLTCANAKIAGRPPALSGLMTRVTDRYQDLRDTSG